MPADACGGPRRGAAAPAPRRLRGSAGPDRDRIPGGIRGRAATTRDTSYTESRRLLRFSRESDQPRRVGGEGRLVEISPDRSHTQPGVLEQGDELLRGV